ncbi:peptidoglycan DD-metalloendopeptidase family protein [Cesiribacter sp. SM1]|uniref:peptidoglycan DD-metalloendopeptidase family protein n=1 Tax=Cesiribacter sp. SM1 TaxID=2861196 RepID=UPI001CD299FC|nr:peptidoglycan DD-metalloendopeptidase family protein [Cesiribacter sp. SM1]
MTKRAVAALMLVAVMVCAWWTGRDLLEQYINPQQSGEIKELHHTTQEEIVEELPEPTLLYGMVVDSFNIVEQTIKPRQNLADILNPFNIEARIATELAKKCRQIFDVRQLAANKKVTILASKDSTQTAQFMIYEPNPTEFVVFSLRDTLGAAIVQREVKTVEKTIYGVINSSLSQSMQEAGGNPALTSKLVDVFAWQIDFFRIQKGDSFRVIYEEKWVEDQQIGIGKILAVQFDHDGEPYHAFYFDQGQGSNYFDEKGNSLRQAFLKAPLNFTRISSRYTRKRFHPVQKRWKAHLGTDYAAPTGTPIYTVGDGVVVEAGRTRGNGNYVKVKHNDTYTTQYLHMSRIAKGMRKGTRVRQGEVIGYVGSTGLATGPHLCFRFWKNGKQIDPFSVKMPPAEPVAKQYQVAFEQMKQQYTQRLATIGQDQAPVDLRASL